MAPLKVNVGGEVGAGLRWIVLEPITATEPSDAREMGDPKTVMLGLPGARVWLPMTKLDEESAVYATLPMVRVGGCGDPTGLFATGVKGWGIPLLTIAEAEGAREKTTLLAVTGEPPG